MKLKQDFGVAALFGLIVLVGTFTLLSIGLAIGKLDFTQLLPLLGSWVGAVVGAYFVIKSQKPPDNGSKPPA